MDTSFNAMNNNDTPINILIDLSKALDSLNHKIVLSKLKYHGFQNESLNYSSRELPFRKKAIRLVAYYFNQHNVMCAIPQGSVLGPLLVYIFINLELPAA